MKLSVIVIAHNMRREIPRTLQSLQRTYQQGCEELEYEVLVIDNNSTEPLDPTAIDACGRNFHYHFLKGAPPSPAFAINYGVRASTGDIVCLMIDGAHILTPGVFRLALQMFAAFANPVVITRFFYLGPASQNESILDGYCKTEEDRLLQSICWPNEGYKLFEIGVPIQGRQPKMTWFNKIFESNCLFLNRQHFDAIGGANERFDIPGGGFLNIDLCLESVNAEGAVPVQLIGEGSFHQLHGGTTTNVNLTERDAKIERYHDQYRQIRGKDAVMTTKDIFYFGHLPTHYSKIHLWNRPLKY